MEKDIHVSKHAVKRYRQRLFDYRSTDEEIKKLLKEIAQKGKRLFTRPSTRGTCVEVKFKGLSVVLFTDVSTSVITTFLGDDSYRKWVKKQENMAINGRILYPDKSLAM